MNQRPIPPDNQPYCSNCGYILTGLTESSKCPECGKPIVEVLVRQVTFGKRYRSKATVFGFPVIDIAMGPSGREMRGVARGLIAIGDVAVGGIAIGGMSVGVIALGGMSIGGFALGGLAIGLILAMGGGAVGGVALGGGAAGIVALGGGAFGALTLSAARQPSNVRLLIAAVATAVAAGVCTAITIGIIAGWKISRQPGRT